MRFSIYFTDVYYILIIVMLLSAFYMIYDSLIGNRVLKQRNSIKRTFLVLFDGLADKSSDDVFIKVGLKLSIKKYTAARNLIIITMGLYSVLIVSRDFLSAVTVLLISIIIYYFSAPKSEIIRGKSSPFKLAVNLIYKKRQQKLTEELQLVCIQMKNIIVSFNGAKLTTDYLFDKLVPYTQISKPIFTQMQNFLYKNRKEEAVMFFEQSFDNKTAKDFGQIIAKIDELPASVFLMQLELILQSLEEEKQTEQSRKDQNIEALVFTAASIEICLVIFNFIYLVMFNTTQAMVM